MSRFISTAHIVFNKDKFPLKYSVHPGDDEPVDKIVIEYQQTHVRIIAYTGSTFESHHIPWTEISDIQVWGHEE